jgi:hypothetical protein
LGVCLAVLDEKHNAINGGQNGGRYCWSGMDNISKAKPKYCIDKKVKTCLQCHFYRLVKAQEGDSFVP